MKGQSGYSFNYNIGNGLPSNHIYDVITDRLGYLWAATENGVVRYNGYDFRLFNQSNGFPTDDIWSLTEDKSGKIWLGNISEEYGYLYNDQYHKAIVNGAQGTIYPQGVKTLGNDLIFVSYYIHGDGQASICIIHNDTIYSLANKDIDKSIGSVMPHEDMQRLIIVSDKQEAFYKFNNNLYRVSLENHTIQAKRCAPIDSITSAMLTDGSLAASIGTHIIFCNTEKNELLVKNALTGDMEKIDLKKYGVNRDIQFASVVPGSNRYYLVSNKFILKFRYENGLKYEETRSINNLVADTAISGSKISVVLSNNFWGSALCTVNNGLWVSRTIKNYFIKASQLGLRDYNYVGGITDSICFLWNNSSHTLATLDGKEHIKYHCFRELSNLKCVIPYHADSFLLTGTASFFFINNSAAQLKRIYDTSYLGDIYATIVDRDAKIYIMGREGFYYIDKANKSMERHYIDYDRYSALVYDSLRGSYWAYNNDKIFIHGKIKDTIVPKSKLANFGVQKISRMAIDNKYGNIFFRGENKIIMYNPGKNTYRDLFPNINLKEATIYLYHGLLISVGQFGVLFCKITGSDQISNPLIYANLKNTNYNCVYDCTVSFGKIFLATDKDMYTVKIPSDSQIIHAPADSSLFNYKFILSYKGIASNLTSGDTLTINQNFRNIRFDVINPFGNGKLKYIYQLPNETTWNELNANELTLPAKLGPGAYYTLTIKAYDDVWQSDNITVRIFISPHWWQTVSGRRLLWGLVIFNIALLLTLIILVTRKIVLASAKKRSMVMELELKAIYAQLNPHFIFNTLNSALLLVKKNKVEEAYTHISTFSRLLRGYLKSSRNKLISIAEEINNLRDYIELQQTRFKEKFNYELVVAQNIQQDKVMIPSLLIQPFVENAINHGILPKKGTGHLKVMLTLGSGKNEIMCIIEDDGIGRKQSRTMYENIKRKDPSYGNIMIKDLVNIFNKYEHMNIEISYTDLEEPSPGTIVTIRIKNPHYA